jgi:ubiquitin carboxyl-terminal hydrolase 2/21
MLTFHAPLHPFKEAKNISCCSALELGKLNWEQTQCLEGSPISDVFMGQFRSSLQCSVCNESTHRFENFWDIGLPIPKVSYCSCCASCSYTDFVLQTSPDEIPDLYQCLSQFTKEEIMEGNNSPVRLLLQ